ncbi:MAG: hypothetical protein IPK12_09880 [Gemmatimonadetes bacterium]|nr:hypothetical protein [Gemmatimonadota bacterium]
MLWLLFFLLITGMIQGRQAFAFPTAGRVRALQEERSALEAEQAALQKNIRIATSRRVLGDRAEQELGLHFPADSEFVNLRLVPGER